MGKVQEGQENRPEIFGHAGMRRDSGRTVQYGRGRAKVLPHKLDCGRIGSPSGQSGRGRGKALSQRSLQELRNNQKPGSK